MLRLVFTALLFVEFPVSFAREIKNLKSCEGGPRPKAASVSPCKASNKKDVTCAFYQGTPVLVEAAFLAPFRSSELELVATTLLKGHEINLPESGNDACNYITPGCNLKKGELYLFTYRFDIMKYYPVGVMPVKIMIRERFSDKVAVCARLKVEILKNF